MPTTIRSFKLATRPRPATPVLIARSAAASSCTRKGDLKKGEQAEIIHIEGDADHPTNRGTLCPKGAALHDFVHAQTRLSYPMMRKPGSDKFERMSWDEALDRIARLMKDRPRRQFHRQEQGRASRSIAGLTDGLPRPRRPPPTKPAYLHL